MSAEEEVHDAVAALRRWEDSGAVWRVLSRDGARITVGLWTCTGDELVDRITSDHEALARYVAGRPASDEPADDRVVARTETFPVSRPSEQPDHGGTPG